MQIFINHLNDLEEMLPINRIKRDFADYLEWADDIHKTESNEYVFNAAEENKSSYKEVRISAKNAITVLYYKFVKDMYGVCYSPITICVAIGEFVKPDKNGIYHVEKCMAYLYYNYELSLTSVDFFYNKLFENNNHS